LMQFLLYYFPGLGAKIEYFNIQLTPDNLNLQGKLRKVRVIRSSSYLEFRAQMTGKRENGLYCFSI